MRTQPVVETLGASVSYGETLALDAVDLEIADGEIVCVLGPSGSGKSTLLRAIAGLERLASGTIRQDGVDLEGIPPHRRNVGLMFQEHALFPHLDVLANVAFGLRMQHLPGSACNARAREVLALVGLAGFEHRRVHQLSGGEQQRVALARALAPAPRLLMLDEPLGALDRALREHLVVELRSLFSELGQTALFVTHDHDEAFALSDRLVVLQDGRVAQAGSPGEVWARPTSEFVARFLGWNVLIAPDGRLMAVRPEGLAITEDGALSGIVTATTFRRDHFLVRVALDGAGTVDIAVRDTSLPRAGDRVRIALRKPDPVPITR